MKPSQRSLLAAALVLVAGWALLQLRGQTPAPAAPGDAAAGPRAAGGTESIPRIGLDRLNAPAPEVTVGERDIFAFDDRRSARGGPGGAGPPVAVMTPPPPVEGVVAPPPSVPAPPPRVPINLKYVGLVESQRGLRVAEFLTDRNEVLTAQAGEVVAHRYRVVKIGLESVDLQDLGTERVQRIPFIKVK